MEILSSLKPKLKSIGLMYSEKLSFWYRVYGYFWLLMVFLVILPEAAYFVINLYDIDKSSDVVIFLTVDIMTIAKILLYRHYMDDYTELIGKLERNIDTKQYKARMKRYVAGENDCHLATTTYYQILSGALVIGFTLPLIVVLFNYLRGTLTAEIWYLPFPGVYFYDEMTNRNFILTYALILVELIAVVRGYGAVDSLFIAMTIHIKAGYEDLQDMIQDMDDIHLSDNSSINIKSFRIYKNVLNTNRLNKQKIRLYGKIKEIADFYGFLTDCFNVLQRITSGIVFSQFAGTILIMCTSLFQITRGYEGGKALSYINFIVCYMSQLFVYAYYGNKLNIEKLKVAEVTYAALWYKRPLDMRIFFQLTIMKAQKQKLLRGLKYLDCSMETFASVIRASGTAFTLLRSIRD